MNIYFRILIFASIFVECHSVADQKHSDAWAAAGLEDFFARATDDIFSESLFDQLKKEAMIIYDHDMVEREKAALKYGGGFSFWMPLHDSEGKLVKPRSAIEAAVLLLFRSDFPGKMASRINGAEWWHLFPTFPT